MSAVKSRRTTQGLFRASAGPFIDPTGSSATVAPEITQYATREHWTRPSTGACGVVTYKETDDGDKAPDQSQPKQRTQSCSKYTYTFSNVDLYAQPNKHRGTSHPPGVRRAPQVTFLGKWLELQNPRRHTPPSDPRERGRLAQTPHGVAGRRRNRRNRSPAFTCEQHRDRPLTEALAFTANTCPRFLPPARPVSAHWAAYINVGPVSHGSGGRGERPVRVLLWRFSGTKSSSYLFLQAAGLRPFSEVLGGEKKLSYISGRYVFSPAGSRKILFSYLVFSPRRGPVPPAPKPAAPRERAVGPAHNAAPSPPSPRPPASHSPQRRGCTGPSRRPALSRSPQQHSLDVWALGWKRIWGHGPVRHNECNWKASVLFRVTGPNANAPPETVRTAAPAGKVRGGQGGARGCLLSLVSLLIW